MRYAALALAACLTLVFLATCGKDSPTKPKPPQPPPPPTPAPVATRIAVTPSPLAFASLGQIQQLTAVVYDQNGSVITGAVVTWSSGDTNVVTVTGQGSVRAVGIGSTQITARSGSASATVPVKVAQVAASIRLSPERLTLGVLGRTATFQATVLDAGRQAIPDAPVTWTSSDESVATVSDEGVVTAVGNGTSTITATSGGATATGDVMVAQDASLIEVMPASARFEAIGQTLQLEAVVYDPDGSAISEAEINWTSGDPLVVTVDDEGVLTAVGQGMTKVTAELGEASTSIPVAVMQEVADLEVAPATAALVVGDTLQITTRATDALGVEVAEAKIDWSSSDEDAATVDAAGVVIAVGAGAATITAALGDVAAESYLEIARRIPMMIEVMPESVYLSAIGATAMLSAVVYDQRGRPMADVPLAWTSGDPAVAEIDDEGLVTSIAEGTTEITAIGEGASASVTVVVKQVVSALTISRISAEMVLGDTLRIRAQARDALNVPVTSAIIEWTSSDESVAAVDPEGLVRAVGEGTAEITASAAGVSIAARITVMHPDRPLLTMLYNAWDGPNWNTQTNWLSSEPLDEWHGVKFGEDNRVSSLNLSKNNLVGSLPPVIGRLSGLRGLALDGNRLRGGIPGELGQLGNLSHLYLSDNMLSGPVPAEIGGLTRLVHLCLDRNRLTGAVPPEIGRLLNLKWLHLFFNLELAGPLPSTITALRLDALLLQGTGLCVPNEPEFVSWLAGITESKANSCDGLDPDREALEALYNATDGASWTNNTNWLTDAPLRNWRGVQTNTRGRVTSLRLNSNNLRGSLPRELGLLARLRVLDLHKNNLTGDIPVELEQLVDLESIQLWRNALTGEIPRGFFQLNHLETLDLANNQLTGTIPPTTGRLSRLKVIDLSDNDLTGGIPSEIVQVESLQYLRMVNNRLSGEIPPELGRLYNLTGLLLNGNELSGTIPPELAELSNLINLQLGLNDLTGSIPSEFARLNGLGQLSLRFNRLTGAIPPELGQLENMHTLFLDHNRLTGGVPAELGSAPELRKLWLHENPDLEGPLPVELTRLGDVETFQVYGTRLCAPPGPEFAAWLESIRSTRGVPICPDVVFEDREALIALYDTAGGPEWRDNTNWLSDLPLGQWFGVVSDERERVIELNLGDNNLAGGLPAELSSLLGLRRLVLVNNPALAGPLPRALARLELESLLLDGTMLCSSPEDVFQDWLKDLVDVAIPLCPPPTEREALIALYNATDGPNWRQSTNWLSDLPLDQWFGVTADGTDRVRELILFNNGLRGTIPPELGGLEHVLTLSITDNELVGGIPREFGNLASVHFLDLSNNQLTGDIPSEMGGLVRLEHLRLAKNYLRGAIPPSLGGLGSLVQLELSYNDLSGTIPQSLGDLGELKYLYLIDNGLGGEIPSELGDTARLERLYLNGNNLSGVVPESLGDLRRLEVLDLSGNNDLNGPLPDALTDLHLSFLKLNGTGLCAPPGDDFRSWLNDIPEQSGVSTCVSSMGTAIYLTQATQSRSDPVPLVAGDPALARVFFTLEEGVVHMPPVRVLFYHGDHVVHSSEIPAEGTRVPSQIDESSLMYSAEAAVPGSILVPGLEVVVEIDPEGTLPRETGIAGRVPETGGIAVDVREMPLFDLTLVPLVWENGPDYSTVSQSEGLTEDDDLFRLTRDLLPVGDFDLTVRDFAWTSVDPVNRNDERIDELFRELAAIRTMDGSTGHYMGILRPVTSGNIGGIADVAGHLSLSTIDGENIAHELGHNFNLEHAPCGSFIGYTDPDYPISDGSIGSWGYDFRGNSLISPETPDLMSYCNPRWIGAYHFTKALEFRLFDETRLASAISVPTNSLLVWGGRDSAGNLVLEPAFEVDALPSLPQTDGPYHIRGTDEDGNELFSLRFDIAGIADVDDGGAFAFAIPLRPDWSSRLYSLELTGPEGTAKVGRNGDESVALLRDMNTGRIRGFLRDWPDPSVGRAAGRRTAPGPGLDVMISRGVPGTAVRQP